MLCIRFRRIARSTGQKAFGSRVLGIPALTAQNTIIINASGYADIIHTHVHMNLIQRACTHARESTHALERRERGGDCQIGLSSLSSGFEWFTEK